MSKTVMGAEAVSLEFRLIKGGGGAVFTCRPGRDTGAGLFRKGTAVVDTATGLLTGYLEFVFCCRVWIWDGWTARNPPFRFGVDG